MVVVRVYDSLVSMQPQVVSRAVCCNGFHPLKTLHGMPGEMPLGGFYSL
jgi:hypothetical protein